MWVRKSTFFLKTKTNLLPRAKKTLSGSQTWFLRQFLSLIGGILEVLGMPSDKKSAVFLNIVQMGGGVNPCSKIMSEIVVCSGGHLTT